MSRSAVVGMLLVLLVLAAPVWSDVYVWTVGSDVVGDGSVGNPYATIQHGIDMASSGETIQVAPGTYQENINFYGKNVTLKSSDPDNPSVVASTIIDGRTLESVVKFVSGETASAVIEGFTIINGRAEEGGGIYCTSSPTIRKNVIRNNVTVTPPSYKGGGGICVRGGSPVITQNVIKDNFGLEGGGIGVFANSNVTITENIIIDNIANWGGGGIRFLASNGTVSNNIITGNYTGDWDGGGILVQWKCFVTIEDNVIEDNISNGGGGIAFHEPGGGGSPSGTVINNSINGNISKSSGGGGGGVLCNTYGTVTLRNNTICGNIAYGEGGGGILCVGAGTAVIENCTVSQNLVKSGGGGALAASFGSQVTLTNSIFTANAAPKGVEIAIWGTPSERARLDVSYSNVAGGIPGIYRDNGDLGWGSGNIDSAALFAALGAWDTKGTGDIRDDEFLGADYHLKSKVGRWDPAAGGGSGAWVTDSTFSPSIDKGDPASSWAGEPTPNGARINQGVYGNTVFASKSPVYLTMLISPVGSGIMTPSPGIYPQAPGDVISLGCVTNAGWEFVNWSSSPGSNGLIASSVSANTTVTILDSVTVTATLMQKCETVTFSPPAGSYSTPVFVTLTTPTSGAEIHYTTNGSQPTGASALYAGPISVSTSRTIKAIATKSGYVDSDVSSAGYIIDTLGPTVSGLNTIPNVVREGVDSSISVVATADDTSRGGSNIVAAEHFIGSDPGAGSGTAMSAGDGAFDEPLEALVGSVNTIAWTMGSYRIHVRGRDAAGNWGSTASILVEVVDGTPPGKVLNLSAKPLLEVQTLTVSISARSSEAPGAEAAKLLDGNPDSVWRTLGTIIEETEFVVLDAGSVVSVGSMRLVTSRNTKLFPVDFVIETSGDGASWEPVAQAENFKGARGAYIWYFGPVDARYVRLSGRGIYDKRSRVFRWEIGDCSLLEGTGAAAELTWTAPADDGYLGSPADQFDLRWSTSPISEGTFASSTVDPDCPSPGVPGSQEQTVVDLGLTAGSVFFALKTCDDVPNWSVMSNVASCESLLSFPVALSPNDGITAGAAPPLVFEFAIPSNLKPVFISFCGVGGFVSKPTKRPGGWTDKTIRFPIKPGTSSWTPSKGQWKAIKKLVSIEGTLYWRLEAKTRELKGIYTQARTIYFDTGSIPVIEVTPKHLSESETAIWPDVFSPPTFYWSDSTNGMRYFYVDISTDPSIPLKDRKRTITLGKRGIVTSAYIPNKGEWKKIRQLATWAGKPKGPAPAEGQLYWRVRAVDSDRLLSCASAVEPLVVDGGTWILQSLDLAGAATATWQHIGSGIVKYYLQFSVDDTFAPKAKYTLKAPGKGVTGTSYTLSVAELKKLSKFADRNGLASLYWRVMGQDGNKAFTAFSGSETVPMP